MTHIIVRNDTRVLSRATPTGTLVWLDIDVSQCTDYRYAITFDRPDAARKCAGMHGATVHTIGDWDETARYRTGDGGGVESGESSRGYERRVVASFGRTRPARLVPPGGTSTGGPRRDAGPPVTRLPAPRWEQQYGRGIR